MSKQSDYTNEQLIKLIQTGVDTQDNMLKLYEQNGGFIHNIIIKQVHGIYEYEDLLQQAYLGLIKAVQYHNTDLEETNFLQILKFCIKTSIRELKGTIPAHMNSLIYKYRQIKREIEENTGEAPTDQEMMLYMDINGRTLKNIKSGLLLQSTSSLDEPLTEDTEITKKDLLIDDNADYTESIEDRELKEITTKIIDELQDQEKQVIIERYLNNRTQESISNDFDCTRYQINSIEHKALIKLRRNKRVAEALEGYIPPPSIYTRRSVDSIVIDNIRRQETFRNVNYNNDLQVMLKAAFMHANNKK